MPFYIHHIIESPIILLITVISLATPVFAADDLSFSGRLGIRGVEELNNDSIPEDPSVIGRIKFDAVGRSWRFHSWLEGGWDGAVKRPPRDKALFKNYHEVYQSNTPYLEFKELFIAHTTDTLDLRAGVQRFSWGRLDEYPPNDLLNPWDYSRFPVQSLEDRKIGVPSLSATLDRRAWAFDAVWVPVSVPYRLALPTERWSGLSVSAAQDRIPNAEITPAEPDQPPRTAENSSIGLRVRGSGTIEWAANFFHGMDPRPVFRATEFSLLPSGGSVVIDPGYVPSFHRITSFGLDTAAVFESVSLRAEAAYVMNRHYNIRRELWGYPAVPLPGVYPLNEVEVQSDVIDYGVGLDYRLFEDGTLILQAQQALLLDHQNTLYERQIETIIWTSLKARFLNQKIDTTTTVAWNPEHGSVMGKISAWYVFTDAWKAGVTGMGFDGPSQSMFGRYSKNDQVEAELIYSW